ncbi:UNVERIFIED_CONTAM: putative glycosyltransferase [Sesamum latifolium]|uniref:Glycosyltransferase n=1 Tax=Sesamum latifolium TaxID=2727402 RepID=A0AAW2SPZ4_9LAMI
MQRRAENKLEQGLARARATILKAASAANPSIIIKNNDIISPAIYWNPSAFYQSYKEMERRFKVYVYQEGELPIVHDGPCKDIYSSEGRFIHEMEHGNNRFKTSNAQAAHVYFMPFSVTWMVKYLYKPNTYNVTPLKAFVSDYVKLISTKHPSGIELKELIILCFLAMTGYLDDFYAIYLVLLMKCCLFELLQGPKASQGNAFLYNTSIRVLCNANSSEGFDPTKDVSLPEIHLYGGIVNPKLISPPPSNISRPDLAFFAGGIHGPIRPILLKHWRGKDTDLHVYEYLPKDQDYYDSMLRSKFCLCPSGYEVASPRIVEAIYAECIPVILSDHYVLPFSDVLRWEAFSIQVDISEIPRLKEILVAVSEDEYLRLKEGLRAVRRHFLLNQPVERFDMFHMILHSVWLRRLNLRVG